MSKHAMFNLATISLWYEDGFNSEKDICLEFVQAGATQVYNVYTCMIRGFQNIP